MDPRQRAESFLERYSKGIVPAAGIGTMLAQDVLALAERVDTAERNERLLRNHWVGARDRLLAAEARIAELELPVRALWNCAEGIQVLPSPAEWERLREPLWDAIQDLSAAYEKCRALSVSSPDGEQG